MPKQAQQRFLDLAVGEVSLVDSPANEKEFIVVKSLNQEDGDMADTVQTEISKGGNAAEPTVETVSVEVAKATNEAVEKAMTQVTALVESLATAAAGGEATAETPVAKADDDDGETVDTEKAVDKAKKAAMLAKLEKQLSGKGLKGDALKNAVEVSMKALAGTGAFKPGDSDAKKPEKVAKNVETDDAPVIDQQAVVQETIKQITAGLAGAQTMATPEAQIALKAAIDTLSNLLKQVQMKPIPANASPSTTVPTSPQFGASGIQSITKGLEGIKEALSGVHEVTKSLSARVEDIEKTRQPSTSGDGSDGTTTQETKKSMWAGVL